MSVSSFFVFISAAKLLKINETQAECFSNLSGSPRKDGNSDTLCNQFMKGAIEAGCTVEKIFVASKKIGYCTACYYCQTHNGKCAINDDMPEILEKMLAADVIVMASPVYFYSISAQLKKLIDRTVARWLEFKDKEFYYIATAAEEGSGVTDCTIECMRGFAACLEGSVGKGVVAGQGVYKKGEILEKESILKQAYEMGKAV